jgi:peptidoglycan/LPS O-acetylase OafA/YrhL
MKKQKEKAGVYFPGLNGLRFFAALAVVLSHVELLKQYSGYPNVYEHPAVYELGRMAVTLFFVLSGYLITYLLLAEKKITNNISVKDFYIRRVLRIWPLYYLIVVLAFFVLPQFEIFNVPQYSAALPEYFKYTFPLFLFFLPQLALSIYPPVPFAEPLWSIGVEEQFYLLWPILIRRFKNFLALAFGIIVLVVLLRHAAFWMATASRDEASLRFWNYVINYFYFTRMECMAIGGVAAWLVFHRKQSVLKVLYNRYFQAAVYALTLYLLVTERGKPVFDYAPASLCFAVLILNVSTNKRSLIKFDARPFTFLGNISFSIYMLHEVVIRLTLVSLVKLTGTDFTGATANVALYAISVAVTLLISAASYVFFEKRFLKLKSSFAVIVTGEEVKAGGPGLARFQPGI